LVSVLTPPPSGKTLEKYFQPEKQAEARTTPR
jgi:hypothetical protein